MMGISDTTVCITHSQTVSEESAAEASQRSVLFPLTCLLTLNKGLNTASLRANTKFPFGFIERLISTKQFQAFQTKEL